MNQDDMKLLKITDVAEILNVRPKAVYLAIKEKKLPALRIGKLIRIRKIDLKSFIDKSIKMESCK